MTADRWTRIEEVFHAAGAIEEGERAMLLDRVCGDDAAMRAEIETLLKVRPQAADFLEHGATSARKLSPMDAFAMTGSSQPDGKRIGAYRILDVLGEGGMGVVYRAEQEHPRRTVALKVIRPGLASAGALRRFEHEALVLGRLHHPGIAQIYEAGTSEAGSGAQPYFAMELVKGPGLTEFAKTRCLTLRQRLEIMVCVCDAVQHAHERGVIHRDLKPGNILVVDAPTDMASAGRTGVGPSTPQPKILDFGVARVVDASARATTLITHAGQIVGTVPYMSPEQVAGRAHRVDARSDVYSLGVICYELLSGRLPYELGEQSIPEAMRTISRDDPARLGSINPALRGDLETIIGKALAKDRIQRYESAAAFGADLMRYVRREPVLARRPSAAYHFQKLVARHRVAAAVLVTAFLALLGFAAGMTLLYARANDHLNRALAAEAKADQEAETAERVSASLQAIIQSFDPASAATMGYPLSATFSREVVLDACSSQIERELSGHPLAQARLMDALGNAYCGIGRTDRAGELLTGALSIRRAAHGPVHVDVASSLLSLGRFKQACRKLDDARSLFQEALTMRRTLPGGLHPDVEAILSLLFDLEFQRLDYDAAEAALRERLAIRRGLGARDDPVRVTTLITLGTFLKHKGDFAASRQAYQDALEDAVQARGEDDIQVAQVRYFLGSLSFHQGQYAEGLDEFRAVLPRFEAEVGKTHSKTLQVRNNIALMLGMGGRVSEALVLFDEVLADKREWLGPDHPSVAHSLFDKAMVLHAHGDDAAAQPLAREAIRIRPAEPTAMGDLLIAAMRGLLAETLLQAGDFAEAEANARECLSLQRARLPANNYMVAEAESLLAVCLARQQCLEEAEPLARRSLPIIRAARGDGHRETLAAMRRMMEIRRALAKVVNSTD